jgi:hypothetical protein
MVEPDVATQAGCYTPCPFCGGARTWLPTRVNTDIWGGSKFVKSLDKEFSGKDELRRYLKDTGLEEAGDRVGGARNEGHIGIGKGYSFDGQAVRRTSAEGK